MRNKKFRLVALLVSIASPSLLFGENSTDPLIVNIDNPNFRKLVVAIPEFVAPAGDENLKKIGINAATDLSRMLAFSGLFNIISATAYKDLMAKYLNDTANRKKLFAEQQKGLQGVDVVQWKALGVESLTFATVAKDAGGLVLSLRTVDINRSELILGKRYRKVKQTEIRAVLRRYADLLLKAYTGRPGIFSSRIVFIGRRSKPSSKQVFISDFDGSNIVQITRGKYPHVSPSWSNDGKFITYTSYQDRNPDLFIYELATGKVRKLSGSQGLNSGSNWAPKDNLVALTGSKDGDANIFVISPKGGTRSMLIKGSGLDVDPSFSPDGKWMAFVSGRYGNPHIFRAELKWDAPDKPRVVKDKRLTYAGWYNATPAWSPDSDKLAFAGYDKDIDRFDLFMMDPDGRNLERLTLRTGDNESPSWSANGQMLVYHSNRKGTANIKGQPHLWVMNRDGSNQRQLKTGLFSAQTPKWSKPQD